MKATGKIHPPISSFFHQEKGFSELLGEQLKTNFSIALMLADPNDLTGGVCIFIGADCDWSERHFSRHGHKWLATLPATQNMALYRDHSPRALRLTYRGQAPGDEVGMIEDLECFGYTAEQIESFTKAAAAFWPKRARRMAA